MSMEKVIIEVGKTPNGYCAACPIIEGWIVAVTGSFDDLKKEVQESIDFYVECAQKDGDEYPSVFDTTYTIEYKFDIESLLFFYRKVFTKAGLEYITGINQKQISNYACGRSKPRKEQADKIVNALHNLAQELMAVSV